MEKWEEEFDRLVGDAPETPHFLDNKVCFVCGQPYNKSKQVEMLKQFIKYLRKKDEEELIKKIYSFIPLGLDKKAYIENIIKNHYKN